MLFKKIGAMIDAIIECCRKTVEHIGNNEEILRLRERQDVLASRISRIEDHLATKNRNAPVEESEHSRMAKIMDEYLNGKENGDE